MKDTIEHIGQIISIDGNHIRVLIVQTSACSSCVAKAHCNASESKEKVIDVFDVNSVDYKVGQTVKLEGSTSMGMKAVMWSFGVPFLVLFSVLVFCELLLGMPELNSGLWALVSLIPYYGVLYLQRKKFAKKFSFLIKPVNN